MNIKYIYIATIIVSLGLFACNSESKKNAGSAESIEKSLENDDDLVQELNNTKKVFYALPSPIETAMLIKRAGTKFDGELLNKTNKKDLYTTTRSKALNFGVYGADLSYASLFSQTQITIDLMAVSKKLADDLGMSNFIENDLLTRLETNINNRDSAMDIISNGFMNSSSFLKESGRPETAALIVAGGWIEGLYIASNLAKKSPNNNELIDRIIDQKMSLITLKALLENYESNSDIDYVFDKLNEIEQVFAKVQVVTSKVEPITNADSKVTTLQAKTEIFVSDEVFNELCTIVDKVRAEIVMN